MHNIYWLCTIQARYDSLRKCIYTIQITLQIFSNVTSKLNYFIQHINSFDAEVDKSRHNGLSAEVDYSNSMGVSAVDYTVCRQKLPNT